MHYHADSKEVSYPQYQIADVTAVKDEVVVVQLIYCLYPVTNIKTPNRQFGVHINNLDHTSKYFWLKFVYSWACFYLLLFFSIIYVFEHLFHHIFWFPAERCDTESSPDETQLQLSVAITVKPCFLKVGRRRWGFGSENKRERQIRIIVNHGGDW